MSIATRECQVRVSGTTQKVGGGIRVVPRDERTTVLLIRHAHTDAIGRWLCGRRLGITLSGAGVLQAEELGRALGETARLAAIYSSPLERARDTAEAIARHQHVDVRLCNDLVEIDFGAWTGKTFEELDADPAWQTFNRARASAVVPGGEAPAIVQQRIVSAVSRLAARHADATIALVSHAEVVRSALLQYRSASLDRYHELDVAPASVSAVVVSRAGVRILFVNRAASAMRAE
jgi:broad specificity phosphatase PhoE